VTEEQRGDAQQFVPKATEPVLLGALRQGTKPSMIPRDFAPQMEKLVLGRKCSNPLGMAAASQRETSRK
jgi:hypothetical protein